MKFADLPADATKRGLVMYCDWCGDTFSADRGDYFLADPQDEVMCGSCAREGMDNPIILAKRIPEHYEPVELATA